jgi:hypothetical protein
MFRVTTLGSASTRWNDYVGTAAADTADVPTGGRSIYELSGLDRDVWRIVAVDLTVRDDAPRVTVYASDHRSPPGPAADGPDPSDPLLVSAFTLSDPQRARAFLVEAFRTVQVRLVAREFAEQDLRVAGGERVGARS